MVRNMTIPRLIHRAMDAIDDTDSPASPQNYLPPLARTGMDPPGKAPPRKEQECLTVIEDCLRAKFNHGKMEADDYMRLVHFIQTEWTNEKFIIPTFLHRIIKENNETLLDSYLALLVEDTKHRLDVPYVESLRLVYQPMLKKDGTQEDRQEMKPYEKSNLCPSIESHLAVDIRALSTRLEVVEKRVEEVHRRFQSIDDSLQMLLQRVTGQDDEVNLSENYVGDQAKDSGVGLLSDFSASRCLFTVTFDDLPSKSSGTPIEKGYKGITWTNVYYYSPADSGPYRKGVVSPPNVAYNGNAKLAMVAPEKEGKKLCLFSLYATAPWSDGMSLVVQVEGYKNGNVVTKKTTTLNTKSPMMIRFDSTFQDLDHFTFVGNGGNDPMKTHVALDEISLALITKT